MRFLISNNAATLAAALAQHPRFATVEAEYGDVCVQGSREALTLAHHGSRSANPAPCLAPNWPRAEALYLGAADAVGLSHLDLDALGGCLALLGEKPDDEDRGHGDFWALAAHVDIRGPHRLAEANASEENLARLHAYWAWSAEHRVLPPRDGSVADVTDAVEEAHCALLRILDGDEKLLAAGAAFKAAGEALNEASLVEASGPVLLRQHAGFVNHLYTTPSGVVAKAVVGFNPATGAVTVSFADTPPAGGAVAIVQGLWGPLAGGHAGIAGSPRGQALTIEDAREAVLATLVALGEARPCTCGSGRANPGFAGGCHAADPCCG
jgi:hypothetical protein